MTPRSNWVASARSTRTAARPAEPASSSRASTAGAPVDTNMPRVAEGGLSAHRTTAVDHRLPRSHRLVEQCDDGGLVLLGDGQGEPVADRGLEHSDLKPLIDRDLAGKDDGVGDTSARS